MSAAVAFVCVSLFAAQPVDTATVTDTVLVEDTPIVSDTPDPTTSATVIEERRLEASRKRGDDLSTMIDRVAGVRVLDLGGPVAPAAVTIRGGSPAQSALIIDGVVLRSPFATGVDPTVVHPESIAHLEVVRGGLGATYGDGALTGALVLRTLGRDDHPRTNATFTYGSLDTTRISAMTTMLPVSIAASFERTSGRFTYVDRQLGLPDATFVRENNDHARGTLSLGFEQSLGEGTLLVRVGGAIADSGTPGLANAAALSGEGRDRRRSGRAATVWRQPLGDGTSRAELRLSAFGLDLDYEDAPRDVRSDTTMNAVTAGGAIETLVGDHFLRVDLTASNEHASSTVFDEADRGRLALAVTDELEFGDVIVHAGARAVHVSPRGFFVLPRVGAVWTATTGVELVIGGGRSLRTPAIDELYHPPEVGFEGNPLLVPETSWEVEAAARYRRGITIATSVFFRRISQTILYLNRNAFVVRPENVGDADAIGGELEIAGGREWGGVRIDAAASSSLLWSRLVATGARLPTQPVFSYAAQLSMSRWGVELATFIRGFTSTFTRLRASDDNVVRPYFVWDVAVTVEPIEAFSIAVVTKNLLDDQTLQTVNRYPLPGRTVFLTLRMTLDAPP